MDFTDDSTEKSQLADFSTQQWGETVENVIIQRSATEKYAWKWGKNACIFKKSSFFSGVIREIRVPFSFS